MLPPLVQHHCQQSGWDCFYLQCTEIVQFHNSRKWRPKARPDATTSGSWQFCCILPRNRIHSQQASNVLLFCESQGEFASLYPLQTKQHKKCLGMMGKRNPSSRFKERLDQNCSWTCHTSVKMLRAILFPSKKPCIAP